MKQGVVRWTLYPIVAQVAFGLSGYAAHISLGQLPGHAGRRICTVVISLMTIVNRVFVTVMPQTVSDKACCLRHDLCGVVKRSDGALT